MAQNSGRVPVVAEGKVEMIVVIDCSMVTLHSSTTFAVAKSDEADHITARHGKNESGGENGGKEDNDSPNHRHIIT